MGFFKKSVEGNKGLSVNLSIDPEEVAKLMMDSFAIEYKEDPFGFTGPEIVLPSRDSSATWKSRKYFPEAELERNIKFFRSPYPGLLEFTTRPEDNRICKHSRHSLFIAEEDLRRLIPIIRKSFPIHVNQLTNEFGETLHMELKQFNITKPYFLTMLLSSAQVEAIPVLSLEGAKRKARETKSE